jgi:hypothetical protein
MERRCKNKPQAAPIGPLGSNALPLSVEATFCSLDTGVLSKMLSGANALESATINSIRA